MESKWWYISIDLYSLFTFERERAHRWGRGGERKTQNTESEADSRLWAVSAEPNVGLKPTNCEIMT